VVASADVRPLGGADAALQGSLPGSSGTHGRALFVSPNFGLLLRESVWPRTVWSAEDLTASRASTNDNALARAPRNSAGTTNSGGEGKG